MLNIFWQLVLLLLLLQLHYSKKSCMIRLNDFEAENNASVFLDIKWAS